MRIEEEIKIFFRNEYHKAMINLTYTVRQLSYEFEQSLKKHNLTEAQYNVLKIISDFSSQGPLSIRFIRERMLEKNSDVSRIVDKLVSKNLIERKENTLDRRQKDIGISEHGLELLDKMFACDKKADTLLKNLSLDEVKSLNKLLDKIRE